LVLVAYVATWWVIWLPGIPRFQGHDTVAWIYVSYATIVGIGLSLVPHVGVTRGLAASYAAMGLAGILTLAFVTFVVFSDGYVKDGGRLWASFVFLAVANVITGTVAVALGLRRALHDSLLISFAALFALPFVIPVIFGVLAVFQFVWLLVHPR
jgi:hypothetical protein